MRTIRRALVANRGEIARRVFRTCRDLGIGTVAVYSDADAEMPFVREADVALRLGGRTPGESYLRADAIVEAALRSGADAVHPGYGFLAENPEFAEAVLAAGLVWVGPSPEVIRRMGSKIESREQMAAAGVPVLPGVILPPGGDIRRCADHIGLPALVKASAGGGGKGMRIVRDPVVLDDAVDAARREAQSAFGDDALLLERYVQAGRHVEIQIFGDQHGEVVALFERECSIQRRHQKLLEESPSPAVDADLRARMSAAAIAAGERLGYVGAGTVEFLVAPEGDFFFLEVNTRLQVEHPVTELVTGLDLVALQLAVAEGRPLPPRARSASQLGHAIEARLYAEDPEKGFLPVTGRLERFSVPHGARVDSGVDDGVEIGPHYDPMLAKVIAHAPTRTEALRRLADSLQRSAIHGLTTNRDFLVRLLRHPEFVAGRFDTHFLERHDPAALGAPLLDSEAEGRHALAAALAAQASRHRDSPLPALPSGWRNNPSQVQKATFAGRHLEWAVGYRFGREGRLDTLLLDDRNLGEARLHRCSSTEVDLEVAGVRLVCEVHAYGETVYVNSALGQSMFVERPRFRRPEHAEPEGALRSPLPGAVVRVLVAQGTHVDAGDPILVVEAMKMEHELIAPSSGRLTTLHVAEGAQVEAGATLAVITED